MSDADADAASPSDSAPAMDGAPPIDGGAPPIDGGAAADATPSPDARGPSLLALTLGTPIAPLGTEGVQAADTCPSGQALIGYTGATGIFGAATQVIGEVVGHCGMLGIGAARSGGYAVTVSPSVLLPVRGADTMMRWTALCPDNQVVVGLAVRAGSALDQLAVQCAPLTLVAQGTGWVAQVGTVTTTTPQGGVGGVAMTALCAGGGIATGSNPKVIAATTTNLALLGAIGLACSTLAGQ